MTIKEFPSIQESIENLRKFGEELNKANEDAHKKWAEENPEQAACTHGIMFDKEAAQKMLDEATVDPNLSPDVAFIMGSPAHSKIRKRWPRLSGPCPKGCGYNGIAYASYEHYIYGDW
jgi:hypothetical protein